MSTFKKAKILMLPTNEPSKIGNLVTYQKRNLAKVIKEGINPKNSTVQLWNLYIISDDEIKEGDYFLADNRLNTTSNKGLPNWVLCKCTKVKNSWVYCNEIPDEGHNGDWCKKIIATTDESLYFKDTNKNPKQYMGSYMSMSLGENLPQPSQQFIQKYIEEYNKGNVITDVLVEYELVSNEEYFLNTINPDENVPYFDENLKINPKYNTITIKKMKENYTNEEIKEGDVVKIPCGVGKVKKLNWKVDNDNPSYIVEDIFIYKLRYGQKKGELQINSFRHEDVKKIVLTTDQELIKD